MISYAATNAALRELMVLENRISKLFDDLGRTARMPDVGIRTGSHLKASGERGRFLKGVGNRLGSNRAGLNKRLRKRDEKELKGHRFGGQIG
jgi:hypothetical protein